MFKLMAVDKQGKVESKKLGVRPSFRAISKFKKVLEETDKIDTDRFLLVIEDVEE